MYKITEKVALNPTVTKMVIEAPLIAKKAKPGQFIIVRPFEDSERIPLTVAGFRSRRRRLLYRSFLPLSTINLHFSKKEPLPSPCCAQNCAVVQVCPG